MKTTGLLKPTLLIAAALCASGAMAQTPPAQILGKYESKAEEIYQTKGKKLTLYALPDPVYSPSYNSTDNSGINPKSEWRWVRTTSDWDGGSDIKGWTAQENYVEITVTDDITVMVKERFGSSGCESGTAETKKIKAVDAPVLGGITVNATANGYTDNSGNEYQFCGDGAGFQFTLSVNEVGADPNMAQYGVQLNVTSQVMDNTGNWGANTTESSLERNNSNLGPNTINIGGLPMKIAGTTPQPTKYTFTFVKNMLRSRTTMVSDVRANPTATPIPYTDYLMPEHVFTFVVAPAPKTGPIYHIPNNYSNF